MIVSNTLLTLALQFSHVI